MSQLIIENINAIEDDQLFSIITNQIQCEFSHIWGYRRKSAPSFHSVIFEKITHYKSSDLISSADKFDNRRNRARALKHLARSGDFIIVLDEQYRANNHVNRSRILGFSFTFVYMCIIAYYPATNAFQSIRYHYSY